MCGIAGIFHTDTLSDEDGAVVRAMNRAQAHRGPDDEGLDRHDRCILGHRRLSIIDLSSAGRQPFRSPDGRLTMVYNGEIYNYIELREELKARGRTFCTDTDTEVLLAAYETYGADCLHRLNGMFAFAVYDTRERRLFLARDRMGIKPLYYARHDGCLYFASEMKAFREVPGLTLSLNRSALSDWLIFNRTDVFEETFFNEIRRLPKGHCAEAEDSVLNLRAWWNPEAFAAADDTGADPDEAAHRVHDLLVSSATLRMRSDVPVGSCLSGGLDSSILLGILYDHGLAGDDYRTFTAAYPGHPVDETAYIDDLRTRYPFQNLRTFPDAESARNNLRNFVLANDEPTTNSSFYAQYEVMRLAREHGVTVLLDGQGGDEIFAGYQYFHGFYLYGLHRRRQWGKLAEEILHTLRRRQEMLAWKTYAFQLLPRNLKKKSLMMHTPFVRPSFAREHIEESMIFNRFFDAPDLNMSLVRHFQFKLEHLLRMEDRNSMAFSLEARVPYLDHRLVEYTLGVPGRMKIGRGETKRLQKMAAGQYTAPSILARRDKIGFGTPRDEWMASPAWQDMTRQHYRHLRDILPDVFTPAGEPPRSGMEQWKINQLAMWLDVFNVKE